MHDKINFEISNSNEVQSETMLKKNNRKIEHRNSYFPNECGKYKSLLIAKNSFHKS